MSNHYQNKNQKDICTDSEDNDNQNSRLDSISTNTNNNLNSVINSFQEASTNYHTNPIDDSEFSQINLIMIQKSKNLLNALKNFQKMS